MDILRYMKNDNEKPLDQIVSNGGFCSIFRTIACVGDSLSSGEFERIEHEKKNYYDFYEYSWGQFMARDTGAKVYNFSRGGMTAREYCEGFARSCGYWDPKLSAQAYIIALGVNDISLVLNGELEFGELKDINPADWTKNKPTFAGYYGAVLSRYKELQPNAKFFLMTIPSEDSAEEKRAYYSDKHRAFLYELAELFDHCYVLDFRKYAPIYDKAFKEQFYLEGHLNPMGYRLTALMTESYIDYIIRNNPGDFQHVGFIGANYDCAPKRYL